MLGMEQVSNIFCHFYIPPPDSCRVLWFYVGCPCVCPSVGRPSIHISFQDDNLSKHQRIFTKLGMCIDLWKSGLGLLIGKFHQFLTELSACHTSPLSFSDKT